MRSSRLVAILMELSRAPRTSVARLAEHYDVSQRTIQRDIAALHEIGVPVWTRAGPGGGIGLVEGWRSPLTGMTTPELSALVMGEAASDDLGMLADFEVARLKLLAAPSPRGDDVAPARERIHVDSRTWFTASGPPATLPVVARAVWSGHRLAISYRRHGSDDAHTRIVDPLGLVRKTDTWYLVAARGDGIRTYRVSRIVSCEHREDPVHRPASFSLAAYWERSRAEFEDSVFVRPVRMTVPEESVEDLVAAVPGADTRRAVDSAVMTGGRLRLELLMEKDAIAVSQLMSVPDVEVVEPVGLRTLLADRAQIIADRNRRCP